ncbi:type II CAAX endopeptidase family protein [Bacillus spongiae]|uniref:Type II CAAX endopeptidase family protein n=1 Tax=Bacillus spongiae TaxID=2683610 RepID=A0ABU8H9F4_9BACI
MKRFNKELPLLVSLLFAHILLYFTFIDKDIFWYMYTAAILFLVTFTLFYHIPKSQSDKKKDYLYGILSGLLLYGIFKIGFSLLVLFSSSVEKDVNKLYGNYSPEFFWHYLVLLFILIPGEEVFWRGFFQRRLASKMNSFMAIFISSIAYASIFYYSSQPIWMLAAFVAGLFWGLLYKWKESLRLVIVSHIVFILFFIILLPL